MQRRRRKEERNRKDKPRPTVIQRHHFVALQLDGVLSLHSDSIATHSSVMAKSCSLIKAPLRYPNLHASYQSCTHPFQSL